MLGKDVVIAGLEDFIAFVIALLLHLLLLLPLLFSNPMIYSVNTVQKCMMSHELSYKIINDM